MDDVAPVRCGGINGECEESRREALVATVHTTDLGDGEIFPTLGTCIGRCSGQSLSNERWVRAMVIVEVRCEDAAQMGAR